MSDFVTLSCPSCGGKLGISQDIDRFACQFCGNEHIVKRGGGIVAIEPIVDGLSKVQRGTDRTAAELAVHRFKDEIESLKKDQQKLDNQFHAQKARMARVIRQEAIWMVIGALVAILCGVFLIVSLLTVREGLGAASAFFGVGVLVIWLRVKYSKIVKPPILGDIQKAESAVEACKTSIYQKKEKLEAHRKIVSS